MFTKKMQVEYQTFSFFFFFNLNYLGAHQQPQTLFCVFPASQDFQVSVKSGNNRTHLTPLSLCIRFHNILY